MRIDHLQLKDFRNYAEFHVELAEDLTIFVGPNGAGKTNIIEAVQFVSTGRSFRNPRTGDLVRWGASGAGVSVVSRREEQHHEVEGVLSADGRSSWKLDGCSTRRTHLAGKTSPVVLFVPDDLALSKGPADQRRTALDLLGEQLSATYTSLRREYQRVVRQRNALLREGCPPALLDSLDEQLVVTGARLHTHRRGLAARLTGAMVRAYSTLADQEVLSASYDDKCGVGVDDLSVEVSREEIERTLTRELARRRQDELARRQTLCGPHRDDLVLSINNKEARSFASQGQQRTIALAWKLAEVSVIEQVLGTTPVLLLDDVMSELDERRRAALATATRDDIQTLMTATDTSGLEDRLLRDAAVVDVTGCGQ